MPPWLRNGPAHRLFDPGFTFLLEPPTDDQLMCLNVVTTTLDPDHAELLSITVIPVCRDQVLLSRSLQLSTTALPVDRAIRQLAAFVGSRPLLGYYLEFDVAMVNKYLEPMIGIPLPNRLLDVSSLYYSYKTSRSWHAHDIDLSFKAICRELGIPAFDPHDPLGKAAMIALMYVRLSHGG
ncbi:MAG: 3'-5' exonuclease [Magnetococcales bacterium]|nr:3'-5' exonuclease [Magnetococcales bacterium]